MEGKFVFPNNHTPVSAIYAIGTSCKLLKPIKIELQHCVDVTEENKGRMKFVKAKHDDVNPPYEFETWKWCVSCWISVWFSRVL